MVVDGKRRRKWAGVYGSGKMILMNLVEKRLVDTAGEGEGGEN